LIAGSVLPQIARLHHRSPFSLPSSVAHIDLQAMRFGCATCSARALPSLLMNQIQITESRFFAGPELEEQSLRGEFVSASDGIVTRIG
jgi:hypothetical protein